MNSELGLVYNCDSLPDDATLNERKSPALQILTPPKVRVLQKKKSIDSVASQALQASSNLQEQPGLRRSIRNALNGNTIVPLCRNMLL